MLDQDEVDRVPPPQLTATTSTASFFQRLHGQPAAAGATSTPTSDGKVTPEELAAYYRNGATVPARSLPVAAGSSDQASERADRSQQ